MPDSKAAPGDGTQAEAKQPHRRRFLANLFMGVGLAASHLTALAFGARFLYPVRRERKQRLLVGLRSDLPPGSAVPFTTPEGQTVNIVHGPSGFIALSDVCPHLGCRVHWEGTRKRFICPCHDGHFDADGKPLSGPPAEMGAALARFKVAVDGNLVFLELATPVSSAASSRGAPEGREDPRS